MTFLHRLVNAAAYHAPRVAILFGLYMLALIGLLCAVYGLWGHLAVWAAVMAVPVLSYLRIYRHDRGYASRAFGFVMNGGPVPTVKPRPREVSP